MTSDGIEGIDQWWSDALADNAAEQASRCTPAELARAAADSAAKIVAQKALIAEWREAHKPLPSKSSARRKDVGRILHEYDSELCGICKTPINVALRNPHPASLQLDHIYPRAGGGPDTWANIQIAHALCNVLKSSYTEGYPSAEQAAAELTIAITHWDDPAQLEADFREVYERTRVQRATMKAIAAELALLPEGDPTREVRQEAEILPVLIANINDDRRVMMYLNRLNSHVRSAQKAKETDEAVGS